MNRTNAYKQHLYSIGNRGAEELRKWDVNIKIASNNWNHQNKRLKESTIAHHLLIADVMVAIEVACMKDEYMTFISPRMVFDRYAPAVTRARYYEVQQRKADDPLRIEAPILWNDSPRDATIFADWIFGIELKFGDKTQRRFFFLEADLDNEDIAPRKFEKASILKKMLVYRRASKQTSQGTITEQLFGIKGIRTLFITTPALSDGNTRVRNFVECAKGITDGKGTNQFLFGSADFLRSQNALTAPLLDGQGYQVSLLNPKPAVVESTS